ncbi:TPA: hypothetical protein N2G38_005547 [Salmonella enterica]|nr:hypothetical protein [Salmonella enterica]
MNLDELANMIEQEFYPNLDKLHNEFVLMLKEHPELRKNQAVKLTYKHYRKTLDEVNCKSHRLFCSGMREAEHAHEALNKVAKYVLSQIGRAV